MNDILNQLDQFFAKQKENEQKLFFFLPILLFGFLSYYFLYPITNNDLKRANRQHQNLKSDISKLNKNIYNVKISNKKTKDTIKKLDKAIVVLKKNKKEVDHLLAKLMFLKFNLDKWAQFYDDIPMMAKKSHLIITSLNNSMNLGNKNNQLVEKRMTLKISLTGNFIDCLRFINKFETRKELVKVKSLDIKGTNMIISIDIYGAKL